MVKEYLKGKSYVSNEEIKTILCDETLTEEQKRKILVSIKEVNQKLYLEEVKKNKELKKVETNFSAEIEEKVADFVPEVEIENKKAKDVTFYLNQIKECNSIEEIINVLPKNSSYDFEVLINTILMHFVEDCVEIETFVASENLTKKEREEFVEELHAKQEIMNAIVAYRNCKFEKTEEEQKNKLIYLTSSSGNVYALSDLKAIDVEYYDSFLELLNSIIDGTFKNVKSFSNNNKIGLLYEVKNFKTRIVFDRLDKHTFVIIDIFMKKTDNDLRYREQITNRAMKYHNLKENLKMFCGNQMFLEENEQITNEIIGTLSKEGETR